jgi:hypothetical protein
MTGGLTLRMASGPKKYAIREALVLRRAGTAAQRPLGPGREAAIQKQMTDREGRRRDAFHRHQAG